MDGWLFMHIVLNCWISIYACMWLNYIDKIF